MKKILLATSLILLTLNLSSNTQDPENGCDYCAQQLNECMKGKATSDYGKSLCKQDYYMCKQQYNCE